jgi:serine protease Do
MKKTKRAVLSSVVLTLSGILLCFGGAPRGVAQQPAGRVVIQDEAGFADAIVAVAEAAKSGVVHIGIEGTVLQQAPPQGPFAFSRTAFEKVPIRALGSGVLISSDGHIITNNHVVENADRITVLFHDGSQEPAKVVGRDPFTDLAVIKVGSVHGVPALSLGNSDALKVGEWVVAIGNPRGLDWTVTHGIVSALHRTDVGPSGPMGFADFIQTDAAINPGNSGGPLLNLKAEVIGLNSMIISQSQGSEGLGFAIPANMVRSIADSLIAKGKVVRGELGLNFQTVDASIIKGLHLPQGTTGAVVVEVIPNTPAAEAGIQQGDVVSRLDDKAVASAYDLRRLISASEPGAKVSLAILRSGKQLQLAVAVMDQLELVKLQAQHPAYELLGLKVETIDAKQAARLGLPRPMGVVVTDVVPGSPAASVGMFKGDIVFRVGDADVVSAQAFSTLIGQAVQSGTVMLLVRDGQSGRMGYLQVPVG